MAHLSGQLHGLSQFAFAIAVASLGAAVFAAINLPLPFILGGMTACLIASIFRLPVSTPGPVRQPMSAIIGVMLGSGFTPEVVASAGSWIGPLIGLVLFLFVAAFCCVTFYRKVAGYDLRTAYFAGMPGGLMEMTLIGESYGADARRIALAHSARILIVVFTLPFLVQLLSGYEIARSTAMSNAPFTLAAVLWLVVTALSGIAVGRVLRLPARTLLGPMAISAVVHATGASGFKPPGDIVMVAQIVLGASIGCRFAGITAKELARVFAFALGATGVLLAITLAFAYGVAVLAPVSPIELMLAYSPGGLAEMGLIALAVNADIAFVAAHHIARVVLVAVGAGLIARGFREPGRRRR